MGSVPLLVAVVLALQKGLCCEAAGAEHEAREVSERDEHVGRARLLVTTEGVAELGVVAGGAARVLEQVAPVLLTMSLRTAPLQSRLAMVLPSPCSMPAVDDAQHVAPVVLAAPMAPARRVARGAVRDGAVARKTRGPAREFKLRQPPSAVLQVPTSSASATTERPSRANAIPSASEALSGSPKV